MIPLTPMTFAFRKTLEGSDVSWEKVLDEARALMTDLLTEMAYLIPHSSNRSYFHKRKPLEEIVYYVPGKAPADIVRAYFEARTTRVLPLNLTSPTLGDRQTALVVNLTQIREAGAQVEAVSGLIAQKLLTDRRTLLLLGEESQCRLSKIVPDSCRIVAGPSQPARWLAWLANKDDQPAAATSIRGPSLDRPGTNAPVHLSVGR